MYHTEWEKENSLSSLADRNLENKWRPELGKPVLSDNETNMAMEELNNTSFVEKFRRIDRTYADPPVPLQTIGLISFTPAKGASPNENGVYGFAKLRGNFSTTMEANQQAETLIRGVDSYHQIYHTYVGRPFPLTLSSKYSAETEEIDIRKEMITSVSTNIKNKKQDEARTVKEIKDREESLLEESRAAVADETVVDPYEEYITLRVKKAQLSWTYLEHIKKKEEIKEIILNTRTKLEELDNENPEFKDQYYEKYMKARNSAGIKESPQENQDNFIKFLVEDAVLPGIDDI